MHGLKEHATHLVALQDYNEARFAVLENASSQPEHHERLCAKADEAYVVLEAAYEARIAAVPLCADAKALSLHIATLTSCGYTLEAIAGDY
jgi:hypothetical protein